VGSEEWFKSSRTSMASGRLNTGTVPGRNVFTPMIAPESGTTASGKYWVSQMAFSSPPMRDANMEAAFSVPRAPARQVDLH